jgi:hypothetical protein
MEVGVKPIGYWLKHLDGLIDTAFEAALGDVERREWQVLNVLAAGERDEVGVVAALQPFPLGDALERLVERGWVEGRYALTAAGRVAFAEVGGRAEGVRERLVEGLEPGEYVAVVGTLERMAGNLERG